MKTSGLFYVQDELYAVGAWMRRNGDSMDAYMDVGGRATQDAKAESSKRKIIFNLTNWRLIKHEIVK